MYIIFKNIEHQQLTILRLYIDMKKKLIYKFNNKKTHKIIVKKNVILNLNVINLKQFIFKNETVIYTKIFVELYI